MKFSEKQRTNVLVFIITAIFLFNISNIGVGLAYTEVVLDGIVFDKDTGTIVDYTGSATKLVIPQTIDGVNVTGIGEHAFSECSSISSISLPESVNRIGRGAFSYCRKLKTINIPGSITRIEDHTFYLCSRLTDITVPDSVVDIGVSAFSGSDLSNITFGSQVKNIGDHAFRYCSSLTKITLPLNLEAIGQNIFEECNNLEQISISSDSNYFSSQDGVLFNKLKTKLYIYPDSKSNTIYTIPNTVAEIESYAFNACRTIRNVVIPEGLTRIGDYAFERCLGLLSVDLPSSVNNIGKGAFGYCTSLLTISVVSDNTTFSCQNGVLFNKTATEILLYPSGKVDSSYIVPNSVLRIGDFAFYGSTKLKHVVIPEGVISIGDSAFKFCENLTSQVLPDSITSLGNSAFEFCYRLNGVRISEGITEIKDNTFNGCVNLVNVRIPRSVTSIGRYAFGNSKHLTSIMIPQNVVFIDSRAFNSQHGFTSAYFYGDAPTAGYRIFDNSEDTITIYYPNTKTGYTDRWKGYKTIPLDPADMPDYPPSEEIYGVSGDYEYWVINGKAMITDYIGSGGAINIPTTLDSYPVDAICNDVFFERLDITSVVIPFGITRIGVQSFAHMGNKLKSITIPSSVTSIEDFAFFATALDKVFFMGNAPTIGYCVFVYGNGYTIYYLENGKGFESQYDEHRTVKHNFLNLIGSQKYIINRDEGLIEGIQLNTSVKLFISNLANRNEDLTILNIDGTEYDGSFVSTGKTISLSVNGILKEQLKTVVLGDVNGDGAISIIDYTLARLNMLGLKSLDNEFIAAADIDGDGQISITDYTLIRLDILGLKSIHP